MRRRKDLDREELISSVVGAWNAIPSRDKPDLMSTQPDLYFACARLAAHETVKREMASRKR